MPKYRIITDSAGDLPASLEAELNVTILPLSVTIENAEYRNYPDERELDSKTFYDKLRNGAMATTAAANTDLFYAAFEPVLAAGEDILYLGFSSALSGTYQNSCIVAEDLKEKYPARTIRCIDTRCASMGEGLLVYLTVQEQRKGKSLDELADWVEETKLHLCHWFTVDDLMFLKRGGRVSATTAVVGSMLKIKPVLHVDDEGRLINMDKVRGRKASITALFEHARDTGINFSEQTIMISHGDCMNDVQTLVELLNRELHPKKIIVSTIGPVIGAHSGPGTLALFFLGTHR